MGLVIPPRREAREPSSSPILLHTEQINSVPLLLGIMEQMGIRSLIDAHVRPHGFWQGASVGTLVSIWLCHILAERDHRLVAVRDWMAQRVVTFNRLLDTTLRDTDCTDDRLANVLSMLGDEATQARLDEAMLQRWIRVYRLPTDTMRLDSTSVSVYHDTVDDDSLLHQGHSKDHRPDLRQFKAMVASLDPLGLPLVCQPVAGNRADDGLYVPVYQAAVKALGLSSVLVVGDSKMGALSTRGHIVAGQSAYLCAYRPPSATEELAIWREQALQRQATWQCLEKIDPKTGEVLSEVMIDERTRQQSWVHPITKQTHQWRERMLVARSSAYQAGLRRRHERTLRRLSEELAKLWQPPSRGRKRYRSRQELERVVAERIAQAKLSGVVQTHVAQETLPDGTTRWVVSALWVNLAAWQALVERLGWQVYVTNTTKAHYEAPALVAAYHQQVVQERGFSRLKSRHLHIRPVYLRDEKRIAGLLWLLCLALRVLTLTEHRLRTALAERGEEVVGLNPASRTQSTARPTTERVLGAFPSITLTTIEVEGGQYWHVTPLNATQHHVLALLKLPDDLYERLANPPTNSNFVLHLRE
jgi:transposase